MAAPRSPNYPQASLTDAIEGVRKVWKADSRNKVGAEVVAKHLGYTTMNGAAQVAVSLLKKYGLLAGGGDKLSVSDAAVTLLEGAPGSPEVPYRFADGDAIAASFAKSCGRSFPTAFLAPTRHGFTSSRRGLTRTLRPRRPELIERQWSLSRLRALRIMSRWSEEPCRGRPGRLYASPIDCPRFRCPGSDGFHRAACGSSIER